jgi:hypothetical protein
MPMIWNKQFGTFLLALGLGGVLAAQASFGLTGGKLHLGNGREIQRGFIGIRQGKLVEVLDLDKPQTSLQAYDTLMDISGKHVYPGFFLLNNVLGLTEVDAVRATLDMEEPFLMTPEVRAGVAYNAESEIPGTLLRNGVLFVQSTPRGPFVAGQSSVLQLNGQPWTQSALSMADGLHVYWPRRKVVSSKGSPDEDQGAQRMNLLLQKFLESEDAAHRHLRETVFWQVRQGRLRCYLHVSGAMEIREALLFCQQAGIPKPVLVGAEGAEHVVNLIREMQVPVILTRLYELPLMSSDPVDARVGLLKTLVEAGVLVALDYAGDMEAMGGRNLAFSAGYLLGEGFKEADILPLIALNPAKITGLEAQIGSLEVGKDASLFVSEGPALDILTQRLTHVWIRGVPQELDTRQEQLYRRFTREE